jgi:lipid A 3-O-deacylase
MKIQVFIFIGLLHLSTENIVKAQNTQQSYMVSAFIDNDCFNILTQPTDNAYTNGMGLKFFYTKNHRSKLFLDSWMPQAGKNSINIYGFGATQVMYTPKNLADIYYQPNDYAWAGGLYATHSLYSYNPQKKYDFQTEIIAGVMGPYAFAQQTQQAVHQVLGDQIPDGWVNQFGNALLLNVNFKAEKELAHAGDAIELIGSAQALAGTMTDAIDVAPVLYIGKRLPYFNGVMAQDNSNSYTRKYKYRKGKPPVQAYLKVKPGLQMAGWNSLLEGGMYNQMKMVNTDENYKTPSAPQNEGYIAQPIPQINNIVAYMSFGAVLGYGPLIMSYTQTFMSEQVKNTYSHAYATLSVAYIWH